MRHFMQRGLRSPTISSSRSHRADSKKACCYLLTILPKSDYLAITTVVQELLSLGRSRVAAMRIRSIGRCSRMIGQ